MATPSLEIFLSDVHFPFEDQIAWKFTLKIIKKLKPDLLWIGGDYVDFYAISRWDTRPARRLRLQEELDAGAEGLRQLRTAAPGAKITLQEGNHEYRLQKYLWNQAPELSSLRLLELPALLGFEDSRVGHIRHGQPQKIGKLWHIHGDEMGGGGVNMARGKLLKIQKNVIFGHHHRHQSDFIRNIDGMTSGSWANGCLCGLKPDYDINPQWTQGVTVVQYSKWGSFHVSQLVYFPAERQPGRLACVVGGEMMLSDK